jgi:hypothetical protein
MNLFNPSYFNSAWAFLTSGSPPLIIILVLANAAFMLLFMYYRGRKNKVDYIIIRKQLQLMMALANTVILFGDSILPAMQNGLRPFQGLIDLII